MVRKTEMGSCFILMAIDLRGGTEMGKDKAKGLYT